MRGRGILRSWLAHLCTSRFRSDRWIANPRHLLTMAPRGCPPCVRVRRFSHQDDLAPAACLPASKPDQSVLVVWRLPQLGRGEQPGTHARGHGPQPRPDAHLLVDVGEVALDGGLRKVEGGGRLSVVFSRVPPLSRPPSAAPRGRKPCRLGARRPCLPHDTTSFGPQSGLFSRLRGRDVLRSSAIVSSSHKPAADVAVLGGGGASGTKPGAP